MTRRSIDNLQTGLEAGGALVINIAAWLISIPAGIATAGATAIAVSYAIARWRR